ncbi:MAG: hypothetical protein AB8G23_05565 [Myxococcota bacterium]
MKSRHFGLSASFRSETASAIRSETASAICAAIGILLILASTSLSAFHAHEVAQHDDGVAAVVATIEVVSPSDHSAPLSNTDSELFECGLCDMGRRGNSEVAILTEALGSTAPESTATRVEQEAPERATAVELASAGPRAPPLFCI